jgi:DNA (cytosine-5)-methyltransferase 1
MSRRKLPAATAQWPLDAGITVVLFAGLGGACAGLEEAGCPVAVANNHDDVALAAHAALHPHTRHVRGDIFDVDPLEATRGERVKVLWASPDCRDHSVAKGGAPRSARVRSLPWQVCRWAGKTRPEIIMLENVREIRGWGPLRAKRDRATGRVLKLDGSVAAPGEHVPVREQQLVRDKARQGKSFRRWTSHIRRLGYDYQDRDLCCADFGIPTSRRRFWAVARRDGLPIGWPPRTHAPRDQAKALGLPPWRAVAEILDWSLPIPSIFDRKRPLAPATERRIAAGMRRFVLECPTPFLVPLTHTGGVRLHPIEDPLRTITTAHRGEFAVVAPHLVQLGYGEREGQAPRVLDIRAPIGTQVATNKFGVVATWMAQHNLDAIGVRADAPLSTLTTRGTQQQVVGAYLAHLRGTGTALPADGPLPTLTTSGGRGGGHVAAVAAFLTKYYGEGGVAQEADEPLHTVSTKARFGVVTTTIAGQPYIVADIGMRMLAPEEAAAAHELRLPAEIEIDGRRRRLTKSEAMRLIGNSVPKRMARLLAEANVRHALATPERKVAA